MAIKTIEDYRFFFINGGPSVAAMTIDLTPARRLLRLGLRADRKHAVRRPASCRSSPAASNQSTRSIAGHGCESGRAAMTAATRISTAAATSAHVPSRRMLIGAALGIVYVVWGSTYLAIRIMVGGMPPLAGAGARFLTAGLLVAVVLVARGGLRRMVVTGRELAGCALIAVLLLVLGQGLVTVGEKGGAPSGITALLIAAVPLWVICYRILSGERPARRTLAGVFLGFGGVAVVIAANGAGGAFPAWTIAVVVLAGLSWAFGSWYQPRLRLPGDPFVVVVYEMLVGGGVLTVLGLASGEGFHPLDYPARSWVAWAYLVVFGSVV